MSVILVSFILQPCRHPLDQEPPAKLLVGRSHPLKTPAFQDTPLCPLSAPKTWGPGRMGCPAPSPSYWGCFLSGKQGQAARGLPVAAPLRRMARPRTHSLRLRCPGKKLRVPGASQVPSAWAPLTHTPLSAASVKPHGERGAASCSHTAPGPSFFLFNFFIAV